MKIDKERITAATTNLIISHCVLERDHISLLNGYRQAWEQKGGDPWLFYYYY